MTYIIIALLCGIFWGVIVGAIGGTLPGVIFGAVAFLSMLMLLCAVVSGARDER